MIVRLVKKLSLRPSSLLLVGLSIYIVNFIIGPYTYPYFGLDGILYLAFCFFCLWLGAFITEGKGKAPRPSKFVFTRKAELILCGLMLGAIGATALTLYYLVFISGVNYSEGLASVRFAIAEQYGTGFVVNKPWWSKLTRGVVLGSVAFYLIVAGVSRLNFKLTGLLGIASLLAPTIYILAEGGRVLAIYAMLIIIFSGILRVQRGLPAFLRIWGLKYFLILMGAVVIVSTLYMFIARFSIFPIGATNRFLIVPGDLQLKNFYASLLSDNSFLHNILSAFYLLSFYLSHSGPFFSWLFVESDYSNFYLGALQFRILGFILDPLGIPFPNQIEIYESQPLSGYYPTFAQQFLLDWGLWLAPVVAAIAGLIIGYIHRRAFAGRFWALAYYPVVMVMCMVVTIYQIDWGSADFVTFMYILLMFVFQVRIRKRRVIANTFVT